MKSDDYERFVQKVLKSLAGPEVAMHHQKKFTGRVSGRKIKIDVSFNHTIVGADLLILVECKCYRRRVSVGRVEEFHTKMDDIGAHKGIMVTTVGYQDGAIKTAKARRIALALLTKKPKKHELTFVVNAEGSVQADPEEFWPAKSCHPTVCARSVQADPEEFWQGNLRGPSEAFENGFRFDSMSQFISLLTMQEWKPQHLAPEE